MNFKDIQKGFIVYILHKGKDGIKATQGRVVDKSDPHLQQQPSSYSAMNNLPQFNPMQALVVDVTIEEDGMAKTYCIPENLSVTYADDMVLATDKDCIIREVQAQLARSEEHIKQTPIEEKKCKACKEILETWDPVFKERRESDNRITKIEEQVNEMKKDMQNSMNCLNSKFDSLLKKLE